MARLEVVMKLSASYPFSPQCRAAIPARPGRQRQCEAYTPSASGVGTVAYAAVRVDDALRTAINKRSKDVG